MNKIEKWYSIEEVQSKRDNLVEQIDKYTEYIENYGQYKDAVANNSRIRGGIKKIDRVIDEMIDIFVELTQKKELNVEVTYAKGIIRVECKGKMYYRKVI